nr:ABC transporter permease subunit [Angustibacter aerolatus]
METLRTVWQTFFDLDAMREALPDMLTVGLRNTLVLAIASAVLGTVLGLLLATAGLARTRWLRWPARVYTDLFRGLPVAVTILLVGVGLAPVGLALWGPNPYPLGILALGLVAAAYMGEIFRSGIQSVEAGQARGQPRPRVLAPSGDAAGDRAAGRASRAAGLGEPGSSRSSRTRAWSTSSACSPASASLFRIGQDYAANTGNASALVLAGLVYLVITVPLTHAVNAVDRRLREGRPADGVEAPDDDAALTADPTTGAAR